MYLLCTGSSAGAGSEVFHIYRHLRRKENIRQNYVNEQAEKVLVAHDLVYEHTPLIACWR